MKPKLKPHFFIGFITREPVFSRFELFPIQNSAIEEILQFLNFACESQIFGFDNPRGANTGVGILR